MTLNPYTAVGLIPEITEIQQRDDIATNLDHLYALTRTAVSLGGLDHPVRLVVLPEGALQGFTDDRAYLVIMDSPPREARHSAPSRAQPSERGPSPQGAVS